MGSAYHRLRWASCRSGHPWSANAGRRRPVTFPLTVVCNLAQVNNRTQIITALAVTIGLLGACGGDPVPTDAAGDDVVETTSAATTTAATTDPPSTDPPMTDPSTTNPGDLALPAWASGEMVTVGTDTGPIEMPVELAPFCESSRSFYLAAKALTYVGGAQAGTAQQLFAALAALAPMTIETAPSEDFATEPTAARDHLAVLIPAFEQIGYDGGRLQELPDPQSVLDTLEDFAETRDSLLGFLVQACGADEGVLDQQARGAATAAGAAVGEVIEPDEQVEAAAGVPITNDDSTIAVSVPADWAETEQSTDGGHRTLVASSDIDTFYGLATPGVLVLRGEGGFRDGGFVGRVLEFQADLEEVGCVLIDERDYDDGTYGGQERIFECGSEGLDVRLLGGATADESLYAMVLLVNSIDEPGIRQLIVNTFQVT